LSEFIAEANRMKAAMPALNEEGPQAWLKPNRTDVTALLRPGSNGSWALTVINAELRRARTVASDKVIALGAAAGGREATPGHRSTRLTAGGTLRLAPGEVRVFAPDEGRARPTERPAPPAEREAEARPELRSRRIIIQNVYPELDCGRFPVKREVGDVLDVWADVFKEGHDKLAVVLKHRRRDESEWHETPMRLAEPGLDRWHGVVRLEENARYLYTIEAWTDPFET